VLFPPNGKDGHGPCTQDPEVWRPKALSSSLRWYDAIKKMWSAWVSIATTYMASEQCQAESVKKIWNHGCPLVYAASPK
jgi:hypothetical protein